MFVILTFVRNANVRYGNPYDDLRWHLVLLFGIELAEKSGTDTAKAVRVCRAPATEISHHHRGGVLT